MQFYINCTVFYSIIKYAQKLLSEKQHFIADINKKLLFLYYFIDNDTVKLKHILVRCAIDTFDALCVICLQRTGFLFLSM